MEKLSSLFETCNILKYDTVGDDVNYKFVEDDTTLYIYFQGSSSTMDWIRNFLFGKRPYKDMEIPYFVHRGFLKSWKQVEDIVISKINEKNSRLVYNRKTKKYDEKDSFKWKEIIVVGYSHGGALAQFCHECVWYYRPDLREKGLYGFGFEAPRIYHEYKMKEELKERWKHFKIIRCNNDLVTHCPPKFVGYCDIGEIIQIYGDTNLAPKKWYIPKCIKSHFPEVVLDGLYKLEEANN